MKLVARIVSTLTLAVVLAACGGGGERREGAPAVSNKPLTIKGSDTMVILGQRLAEEYMKASPGTVVQVNGGGSGTGIAALINGTVDLAQASRPMKDDEKAKVKQARGADVVETAIALDALAVFVNTANPVQNLTVAQVKDIYQGKLTNWSQVGGPNAPIVLYGRESSSGTYDYFREHVLNKEDFAPNVQTLQGTAAIINAVGQDRNGIGYGGIAYAKEVRAIGIQAEGAQPVAPSEQTVADGTYPLSRKLYFYYAANAPERVTKFAQWALTPEAQALVTKVGYFPLPR
ncbi:MAG TPA: PstS family phosphate ABC transporter substrate-binding protein [Thermoanaerobaculia bacterium]|nr:PstS family phosphate ABC transporter substrate-binding protein [Thermoanaerobaculia bacterium]